jgi:hypothetical protein
MVRFLQLGRSKVGLPGNDKPIFLRQTRYPAKRIDSCRFAYNLDDELDTRKNRPAGLTVLPGKGIILIDVENGSI